MPAIRSTRRRGLASAVRRSRTHANATANEYAVSLSQAREKPKRGALDRLATGREGPPAGVRDRNSPRRISQALAPPSLRSCLAGCPALACSTPTLYTPKPRIKPELRKRSRRYLHDMTPNGLRALYVAADAL